MHVDLGALGFAEAAYPLVKRALLHAEAEEEIAVDGTASGLDADLRGWCRIEGHRFVWRPDAAGKGGHAVIANDGSEAGRWAASQRVGQADARRAGAVAEHPPRSWGLAARRAMIDAGTPEFNFHLVDKIEVWGKDIDA